MFLMFFIILFGIIFLKDDLPNDIREDLYIKRQEYLENISDKNEIHSGFVFNKRFNL